MKKVLSVCLIILFSCNMIAGCTTAERQDVGMVAGCVVGGLAGTAFTAGSPMGTIAGAAGGGLIGKALAK